MVLCPKCSIELRGSDFEKGFEQAVSLKFVCKVGNTAMWVCPKCHNFYFKRYMKSRKR